MADDSTRVHLRLNSQSHADLNWLACHRQVPFWEAVRRALALERRIAEAQAGGARVRIIVEAPGEPVCELAPV